MNISFIINQNYIGQFKVTLWSLMRANQDAEISVHLLYSGLDEKDKKDISEFTERLGAEIAFYEIDRSVFMGLPTMRGDETYSAYYKVLLPYLLSHLEKVLFLDCDIIVNGSILPLYNSNNGKFLSCCADFRINQKRKQHIQKITGKEDVIYFNTGVLLFDFSHKDQLVPQEAVFSYIRRHHDDIVWHDQDIYNHFYAGNCFLFEEKYNYVTVPKNVLDSIFCFGRSKAVIIHYANWKPWNENYIGKCYGLYKKTYKRCGKETELAFFQKRHFCAQIKLIVSYLTRSRGI